MQASHNLKTVATVQIPEIGWTEARWKVSCEEIRQGLLVGCRRRLSEPIFPRALKGEGETATVNRQLNRQKEHVVVNGRRPSAEGAERRGRSSRGRW